MGGAADGAATCVLHELGCVVQCHYFSYFTHLCALAVDTSWAPSSLHTTVAMDVFCERTSHSQHYKAVSTVVIGQTQQAGQRTEDPFQACGLVVSSQ